MILYLWAIAAIALSLSALMAGAWLVPALMDWILVHVTGIPPLEPQMLRSRGERYRGYQSCSGMFFPLPPQKHVQKGVVT
jgi:steroid 5-alpha reductase family enzyme